MPCGLIGAGAVETTFCAAACVPCPMAFNACCVAVGGGKPLAIAAASAAKPVMGLATY